MAIPNPNPNIADGVKCDNKTYSSNKIESLISSATELPIPEAGDAGKVLTVNAAEDGYELESPLAIDDSTASATSVYSSSKVDTLLNEKQDASTALKCVIVQGTLTNSVTATSGVSVLFDNADIKNGNIFSSMAVGTLADIPDHILGAILIWTNTGVCMPIGFLPGTGSSISISIYNLTSSSQTVTGVRLMLFGY